MIIKNINYDIYQTNILLFNLDLCIEQNKKIKIKTIYIYVYLSIYEIKFKKKKIFFIN